MASAHFVKKARKDYPDIGVKKGESYWWWEFRFGGTYRSKTQPRPSQLTQSEFLSTYLGIGETLEDALNAATCKEDVESAVEEAKSSIEDLKSETESKLDNMPDGLRDADTGQMMQERIDQLDEWYGSLDSIDYSELEQAEQSRDEKSDEEETPESAEGEQVEDESTEIENEEEDLEEAVESALQNLKDEIAGLDPGIS